MCFRLSSMFLFLLLAHLAFTQEPPSSPPDQPSVKELLRRIDRLEKRVNELEANEHNPIAIRAASAAQQPAPPVQSQQPDTASALSAHEHIPSSELQQVETHYPSLQIHGFGNVDFSARDQKGSDSGFNMGQFVLHFASPLSEKVRFLANSASQRSRTPTN